MKRILHVVMTLDAGGVENWLLHVARRLDPRRIRFDFAVASGEEGAYEEELRAMGSRIFHLHAGRNPLFLSTRIREVLRRHGPFHAVHGHLHHLSGLALRLAEREGVPARIAHAHVDTSSIDRHGGPIRTFYRRRLRQMIRRHATLQLAVGESAARSLFGDAWKEDPRVRILPCALDFSRFHALPDAQSARARLGLGGGPVLGTVGRLEAEKNQAFLLEVLAALLPRLPEARLMVVGGGSLEDRLRRRARDLGLGEKVFFTGPRTDVPELLAAMDLFLFPSLFEGLGLAPIEAQAAGLPCLISDRVPGEVVLFPERVVSLPLGDAGLWAERSRELLGLPRRVGAVDVVESSPFGMAAHLPALLSAYEEAPVASRRTA